ncbi:anti-sigma factor [Bacilliculturomica massiliensis]|uniref:anti-sigma factor n=1 Tax=Bacilliculturomica massiliensis TaxID=1917867 RepID=UPI001031A635|nr:zf-HC2 domain-containing protein [Bacilliculturomica massiliensis]
MRNTDCEKTRERLSDYLDGSLLPQDRNAVEEHLGQCGRCREEAEQLREIMSLLSEIPAAPVPDRFDLDLRRALRREIEAQKETEKISGEKDAAVVLPAEDKAVRKERKRPRWKIAGAAAAVFMVGILSVAMMQDGVGIPLRDLAIDKNRTAEETESAADSGGGAGQDQGCQYSIVAKQQAEEDGDEVLRGAAGPAGSDAEVEAASPAPQNSGGNIVMYRSAITEDAVSPTGSGSAGGEAAGGAAQDQDASTPALMATGGLETNTVLPGQGETSEITDSGLSRGAGFSSQDEYSRACAEWMGEYVEALNTKDAALFSDTVATAGINGYTTDAASFTMKLYEDYLGTGELTFRQLHSSSIKLESSFLIEGSRRQVRMDMTGTSSGLSASEILLDLGPWLSGQISETDFTLEGYDVKNGGSEVVFRIETAVSADESGSDGAEDKYGAADESEGNETKHQVKEIVWKKTE